jgi:hypothetical protein
MTSAAAPAGNWNAPTEILGDVHGPSPSNSPIRTAGLTVRPSGEHSVYHSTLARLVTYGTEVRASELIQRMDTSGPNYS